MTSTAARSTSVAALAFLLAACGGDASRPAATATPTASATAMASRSATPSASATRTPSASPTAANSATETATPVPSASATPSASPTATTDPLRLPDLHAEPDPVGGGRVIDAEGREVLLRGVNVNALAEYWQYGSFPTVFPLPEADADVMAGIGWNAVRLLLSWSRVEPAPGAYDAAYLEQVRGAVRLLASRGIYSIIDLHQDAWGATLAARPDEACVPPSEPAFGWDGAPEWATLDGGVARCASLGIRELSPAVSAAFAAFFNDAEGPGGVGIRTRYAQMLGHVARVLAAEPGVAGYDLMNEPNAFSDAQVQQLADLYADALVAIRAGERDAGSPPRLVLFEPGALWALLGSGAPPDFARDRDVVYAPHLYQGGLDDQPLAPAFQTAVAEAQRYGGAPVLTGEWGSDPRRAASESDRYFLAHQELQDQYRISATLWTWHESCGDPHKAGDVRAGNLPYVWGEFEVDCTTNAITGVRQPLVDQLTRGLVRAAPGRLAAASFAFESGALAARGVEAAPNAELLVFYPSARYGPPHVEVSGLAAPRLLAAAGGNQYLVATATGGAWTVDLAPGAE